MSTPRHPRKAQISPDSRTSRSDGGDHTFPNENVVEEGSITFGDRPYHARQRPESSSTTFSASPLVNQKTPARSFYHRAFHGSLDPVQYSTQAVRQQTAELASLALSENKPGPTQSPPSGVYSNSVPKQAGGQIGEAAAKSGSQDNGHADLGRDGDSHVAGQHSSTFSVPTSSALTEMLRNSPPSPPSNEQTTETHTVLEEDSASHHGPSIGINDERSNDEHSHDDLPEDTEQTSLLHERYRGDTPKDYGSSSDPESQGQTTQTPRSQFSQTLHDAVRRTLSCIRKVSHPKSWNRKAMWENGVKKPVGVLPAVFLGLLLNILDALSYGMILFPLGQPLFADLGSDGISIFYVSTIISQLVFSCGGSIFRGGIGSEMIEVVPFFHRIAFTILNKVGEDNPKSVLATTVLAYSMSSVLTGAVFFLMGACRLGSLIGFFPRHILIGCIGGVGWFLVATGLEVSARLDGNLEYNLATLSKVFQVDTISLWLVPLALAALLLFIKRFVHSNFLVGGYFVGTAVLFYFFKFALGFELATLRDNGWVFDAPSKGNPWYHFYTLYDFKVVNWSALADTIPAMFALTFFGVLHVPINVPALGMSTGEDNLDVDRELIAHGVSNAVSGLAGSIQNYLVYTNSLMFIDSGGNSRLAGIMLAFATFGILLVGPVIIGFIPIMVVGALIFLLGIELMEEALVDTWGRLSRLEYLTVIVIVVTMGAWDFVIGIVVGIILACVNFVVQTSRRSAIRATYSGQVASSTVRRHPVHLKFLKEAGKQTYVIKLAGFLFFGTIVGVENRIREILAEDAFSDRPLRFVILDLAHINGVDFSAAEAFTRINRLLRKRNVNMVISGLAVSGDIGSSLRNVGLFSEENEVEIFVDLNEALEFCENDLLKALYRRQEQLTKRQNTGTTKSRHLDVPKSSFAQTFPSETMFSSPRRNHLHEVAATALPDHDSLTPRVWANFKQPLPLLLQIVDGLSDKNEDFWFHACRFLEKRQIPAGTTLYSKGDTADGFFILEDGILRAEYEMPQGKYWELIVAGRPCGELPFFSETARTATVTAERDSALWQLDKDRWSELQREERDVASELLKVSMKLTKERMDAITSYVLTTAG